MSKWISVNERLPKKDELVLAIANGKPANNITLVDAYELGKYTDEGWIIDEWPEWRDAKVTHWMPLPEPPGEITVFDRLTESPEALAEFISRVMRSDISNEFCKPGVSAKCDGDECPKEKLCIIRWLQSPAEEG